MCLLSWFFLQHQHEWNGILGSYITNSESMWDSNHCALPCIPVSQTKQKMFQHQKFYDDTSNDGHKLLCDNGCEVCLLNIFQIS